MKSRIAILSCLAVAAMMILPTVSAGDMDIHASTDKSSYQVGEEVQMAVDWIVTDPNDFDHDECHVLMDISYGHTHWYFQGHYDVPEEEATGAVPVWCGGADGFANYWWDTTTKNPGSYQVEITVTATDDSQSPPNRVIIASDIAYFTLI